MATATAKEMQVLRPVMYCTMPFKEPKIQDLQKNFGSMANYSANSYRIYFSSNDIKMRFKLHQS